MTLLQRMSPLHIVSSVVYIQLTGLPFPRWQYLETGIEKIMTNLKDGVDMVTVCVVIVEQPERLLTLWHSTWASTREFVFI